MRFLGFRSWPVPMGHYWPFVIAGGCTWFMFSKLQAAALEAPEYKNSPKNPYLAKNAAQAEHH
ncbi:hypothetical protein CALVIDRAFT_561238 [Calocera viscosa TUFC12733]|uniref:ATPase, F0 complex, subunit J n=1 Tax=Calocera viscosa (strain TUFC12733) TaxID=1330018 RepID=A0A167Q1Y9_CALVF|nr:hypothetical protein CALVIDRAFT_561205 [Calocera viscosa TUFC12733]KZO99374.1 hypothetical protein CALVIDRAFT_561238 [Calocera viscosa TUFC12733]